jgi:AcrR family transcriptional regulator
VPPSQKIIFLWMHVARARLPLRVMPAKRPPPGAALRDRAPPSPADAATRAAHEARTASILRAAGELLDERGTDGLNTTAIAQRAGISTATLYQHFPDKQAVLRALVQTLQSERESAVAACYDELATAPDWRVPLAAAIRTALRLRVERPGGRSSRRALQTSPELWQWDHDQTASLAKVLARAMRRRKPTLTRATSERVALVAVSASIAVLDLASLDLRRGAVLLAEADKLRNAYLAGYLD